MRRLALWDPTKLEFVISVDSHAVDPTNERSSVSRLWPLTNTPSSLLHQRADPKPGPGLRTSRGAR
jgi:hypothetical protein